MHRISKRFTFSAAHYLRGLPPSHPCSQLHGHNYVVEVVLESTELNEVGFVRDYRDLGAFKNWLDKYFDHKCINDVLDQNPTAENMAKAFYETAVSMFPEVEAVGVSETDKTEAWYSPNSLTLEILEGAIQALPEPHQTNFREAIVDTQRRNA